MIPSENLKFRHRRYDTPARGYRFPGGTYQYGFCLNSKDQTLSVWDCSTDTITATVTLASSKNFCCAFYRSIDKSVYVLGTSGWLDRVDLDPDSGTFCTVVESGDRQVGSAAACYIPYPFDGLIPGRADTGYDFDYIPIDKINDTANFRNRRTRQKDGRFYSEPPRFGHQNIVHASYHPTYNMLQVENQFFDILVGTNDYRTDYKFKFRGNDILAFTGVGQGANQLGGSNVVTYLFKNFLLAATGGSCYVIGKGSNTILYQTLTHGCGSSGRFFYEYDPFSRRVMMQGKLATQGSVFELGNGQLTDLGDLSRAAYLATNETGTEDMAFNPVYKKVYVQGRRHGAAGETGVDKIYVYDLAQSLGSMYLGAITVGGNAGAERSSAYAVNMIGFNGNRYFESDHAI